MAGRSRDYQPLSMVSEEEDAAGPRVPFDPSAPSFLAVRLPPPPVRFNHLLADPRRLQAHPRPVPACLLFRCPPTLPSPRRNPCLPVARPSLSHALSRPTRDTARRWHHPASLPV